jgi:DNA-binding SARP family transcriptional activator
MAAMPGLSIHLFGTFTVDHGPGWGDLPCGSKARELLCYLLLHRDRPVARTSLAELLWSDQDAAHGLKQLRQALWQLQSACGRTDETPLLEITPRSVMLKSDAILSLDIAAFEQAFEQVRGPASRQFSSSDVAVADSAITLYRGDLLEGFDYDWCIVEREFLRSAYLTMLDRLMISSERDGEYELGIDYGERILRVDRAREYTHRRMMYLHALLGNRTGALRQFERCRIALAEELDVAPARPTVQLHALIRTGADLPSRTPHHTVDLISPQLEREVAPLERLRGIQRALQELQSQIQAEFGPAEG